MKVLFAGGGTGGHLYPALALADAVRALRPDVDVHFVGATRGVETRVLPAKGVPHTLVPVLPLDRSRPWRNWRLVPSLARSIAAIRSLFASFRPQLVVGTGGYASAPACLYAAWRGVPMALQEQNAFPGRTTKLLARWASQIHLGFPEAERHLKPGRKARIFAHGNPIVAPDTSLDRRECRSRFGLSQDAIVVLVVGGSQGGRGINEAVLGAVERVVRGELDRDPAIELLWATGAGNFESIAKRLEPLGAGWVRAVGYIDDMPRALAATDMAVSRAGAMMTGELQSWGIPSILVPLPTSAEDHQTTNAEALAAAGAAEWTAERDLTPERLWALVTSLAGDEVRRGAMSAAAKARSDAGAASAIAKDLLTLVAEAAR